MKESAAGKVVPQRPPRGVRLADVDELELRVEKLVAGGEGLGRFEGIPIFVPRAAPGDRLRVRLEERRPDYGRAEILEILEPGPGRRTPPCRYFDRCGGCDLQHLGEVEQLRAKVEAVRETLKRLGRVEAPTDIRVLRGPSWGYRLRAQLHVGETPRGIEVGYFGRASHDLVPVRECPVLVSDLERRLPALPRALRDEEIRRLDIAAGSGGAFTVAPAVEGLPTGEVTAAVGDFVYSYDARCFFQAHRQLLPVLVEQTIGEGEGDLALDFYAGVGLFTLPLARRYERVIAVEGDRVAARYAKNNARKNKLANVTVDSVVVDGWLRRSGHRRLVPDRVVVDPPRDGLSRPVREWLLEKRPPRLTYVSCHAATLARDLRRLQVGYFVTSLALLDMFPQTGHMEVVVQMACKEE